VEGKAVHTVWKGRGATRNPEGRFERTQRELIDDGWGSLEALHEETSSPRTELFVDKSRSVITTNDSPDIPFEQSINPYRGCEHGCIYCYARPSHGYLGLSAGLDFETKIFTKPDAAALLRRELARPGYRPQMIALGTNTDPYQPVERRLRITRGVLEVLAECRHPVGIVTKSAGVIRDLDLLTDLARDGLVRVDISITTLDPELARTLEPRASSPAKRLAAVGELATAQVPVGVNMSPIIPGLNDHEIEALVETAAAAGAIGVNHILVRLPFEVKELFEAWLREHRPERAEHILSLIRQCRGGRLNDPRFGERMRGSGAFAELVNRRFEVARQRHGLTGRRHPARTALFRPPANDGQMRLL
jgi:DNA repair photolyase